MPEDAVRMSGHVDKQVEFFRRQTHGLPMHPDAMILKVDVEFSDAESRFRRRPTPPKGRPHTGQQPVGDKGLHKIVVGPRIERGYFVPAFAISRNDANGYALL